MAATIEAAAALKRASSLLSGGTRDMPSGRHLTTASGGSDDSSDSNAQLRHECASLKDEMAVMQARFDAAIAAAKSDARTAVEEAQREAKRVQSAAAREVRDAQKRIVALSAEIARLREAAAAEGSDAASSSCLVPTGDGRLSTSGTHADPNGGLTPRGGGGGQRGAATMAGSFAAAPIAAQGLTAMKTLLEARESRIAELEDALKARDETVSKRESEQEELQRAHDATLAELRALRHSDGAAFPDTPASASSSPKNGGGRSSGGNSPLAQGPAALGPADAARLRDATKRVVLLSGELARCQQERDAAQREAVKAKEQAAAAAAETAKRDAQLERLAAHIAKSDRCVADSAEAMDRLAGQLDDAAQTKLELARLKAVHAECDRREQAFVQFRSQHDHCAETMVEQRARIFYLENQLQRAEARVAEAQREVHAAGTTSAELRRKLAVGEDDQEGRRRRAEAELRTALAESAQRQQAIDTLRKRHDEAWHRGEKDRAELALVRRELEELRASSVNLASSKASAEAALEAANGASAELATLRAEAATLREECARLREEGAAAKQECRRLDSERQAAARDHAERLTALQRTNLELQEARLAIDARDRDLSRIRGERDTLVSRINEMEGSRLEGTATTARRLTGLLEAMPHELSTQVAEHLRGEFMRGGTRTAALFRQVFNLDADTSKNLIDVLSHLYLAVRTGADIGATCRLLSVKEITVRRIVAAFNDVNDRFVPGPRRRALQMSRPPAAAFVFRGRERVLLLAAAARPDSSIHALTADVAGALPLAKICSFLAPALVGVPAFASHTRREGSGRSIYLRLDMDDGRFTMHEALASAADGFTGIRLAGTIVDGAAEALGTRRLDLVADAGARCTAPPDPAASLTWVATDTMPTLRLTVRWDRRHTCLHAEIAGGARLAELAPAEAATVAALSTTAATVADTLDDRVWSFEAA